MPVNAGGYAAPSFAVIASNSIGDSELPAAMLSAIPFRKSLREMFSFLVNAFVNQFTAQPGLFDVDVHNVIRVDG